SDDASVPALLGTPWADAVAEFALALGRGLLAPEILGNWDYVPALTSHGEGSGERLELAFAIFTNVLRMNEDGLVINAMQAQHRTAQYVRRLVDHDHTVQPAFRVHEVMRWL